MTTRSNPFPVPSPLQARFLQQVAVLAAQSYTRGWNQGTAGNFSVRGSGRLFWQSPSGVPKGALKASAFLPVDMDSLKVVTPDLPKPSDETPLHAALYRLLPQVRVVLHAHPPHTVRLSARGEMAFLGQEMAKVFGTEAFAERLDVPVIANTQNMIKLGSDLASFVNKDVGAIVLQGHGVYTWGDTPEKAMARMEGLEFLCQSVM